MGRPRPSLSTILCCFSRCRCLQVDQHDFLRHTADHMSIRKLNCNLIKADDFIVLSRQIQRCTSSSEMAKTDGDDDHANRNGSNDATCVHFTDLFACKLLSRYRLQSQPRGDQKSVSIAVPRSTRKQSEFE